MKKNSSRKGGNQDGKRESAINFDDWQNDDDSVDGSIETEGNLHSRDKASRNGTSRNGTPDLATTDQNDPGATTVSILCSIDARGLKHFFNSRSSKAPLLQTSL